MKKQVRVIPTTTTTTTTTYIFIKNARAKHEKKMKRSLVL